MSKHHFTERLKRMLDNECEITQMETRMATKSSKYFEEISELKNTIARQLRDLQSCGSAMDRLRQEKESLEKFVRSEAERVAGMKETVKDMHKEFEDAVLKRKMEEKGLEIKMDFIRKIKMTTETYFNCHALPETFQGVQVYEKDGRSQWKPFKNDVKQWIQFLEEQLELMKQNDSNYKNDDTNNKTILI